MTGKKVSAKPEKRYRILDKELPIRVDLVGGGIREYKKPGEIFKASDWPMPHITIPNMLNHGHIEEVE